MNYTAQRIRQGAAADTKVAGIADPGCWVNARAVAKRRLFAPHFELHRADEDDLRRRWSVRTQPEKI